MRRGLVGIFALGLVITACGARTPLLVDETCEGPKLTASSSVPTLYFVLDHSRSMRANDKWGQVRSALATVISRVDTRARFATVMYPDTSGVCSAGREVMPPTRGNGVVTVQQFLNVTAPEPDGGTPTAETLRVLAGRLQKAKNTFVVLATDGGPNCNSSLTCGVDQCVLNIEGLNGCTLTGPSCCDMAAQNCLDDKRAIGAVTELAKNGVQTYVVGIPGSEIYSPVLDAMAIAGGTAQNSRPRYFQVQSVEGFTSTLEDIANRIVRSCTLSLDRAPKDPGGVNVRVSGEPRAPGEEFVVSEDKLTLLGAACEAYGGDTTRLEVRDGCAIR